MPPELPPVGPQQVEIYLPGNNPNEDYEPLSDIDQARAVYFPAKHPELLEAQS